VSRSWILFLRDMLDCARKIERFTSGRSMSAFMDDEMARDAVLRNLEILGEAAKHIPEEVRRRHGEVDWRSVGGLRDVLAHAYFALDDSTLWKIVREDLPRIVPELERIALENRA
jgi:uncharacterized protein with HEPN domain